MSVAVLCQPHSQGLRERSKEGGLGKRLGAEVKDKSGTGRVDKGRAAVSVAQWGVGGGVDRL